jgi:hypothetical protein
VRSTCPAARAARFVGLWTGRWRTPRMGSPRGQDFDQRTNLIFRICGISRPFTSAKARSNRVAGAMRSAGLRSATQTYAKDARFWIGKINLRNNCYTIAG